MPREQRLEPIDTSASAGEDRAPRFVEFLLDAVEPVGRGREVGAISSLVVAAGHRHFRLLTLPTTQKGTAKLRPGRGIKVNYLYYWSDAFLDPDAEGTQVPVRYDPFDAGVVFAFIRMRWEWELAAAG